LKYTIFFWLEDETQIFKTCNVSFNGILKCLDIFLEDYSFIPYVYIPDFPQFITITIVEVYISNISWTYLHSLIVPAPERKESSMKRR
jgi:hypothetical protein